MAVRAHALDVRPAVPRVALIGPIERQAGLAAAAAYWSQCADRDHPTVEPLRREVRENAMSAPTLYRGFVTHPPFPSVTDLQPGAILTLPFVSFSAEEAIAEDFSWDDALDENDPNLGVVMVELRDGLGVDISGLSEFPEQQEWLVEGVAVLETVTRTAEEGFDAPSIRAVAVFRRDDRSAGGHIEPR